MVEREDLNKCLDLKFFYQVNMGTPCLTPCTPVWLGPITVLTKENL